MLIAIDTAIDVTVTNGRDKPTPGVGIVNDTRISGRIAIVQHLVVNRNTWHHIVTTIPPEIGNRFVDQRIAGDLIDHFKILIRDGNDMIRSDRTGQVWRATKLLGVQI